MEFTIKDLKSEAKEVVESRKRVDEEIQKLESKQEQKEAALLDKLAIVRMDKMKKIEEERAKCLKVAFDTRLGMLVVLSDYVVERGNGNICCFGSYDTSDDAITKLKIDGEVLTSDDNPTLFDFVNGGLGIIYDDERQLTGHYYSEPILEKILDYYENDNLESRRLTEIKFFAYSKYLKKVRKFVCTVYGHDWYLSDTMSNYDFSSRTDKFIATYRCKDCGEEIREIFERKSDVKPLPSVKKRMNLLKLDAEAPKKFDQEDYFVKVDRPKKMSRKISNK